MSAVIALKFCLAFKILFTSILNVTRYTHLRSSSEPECCDGSDEYNGVVKCPNVCKEAGAEYRQRQAELAKLRAEVSGRLAPELLQLDRPIANFSVHHLLLPVPAFQGVRIKLEYIAYGQKIRKEREEELSRLQKELSNATTKIEDLKGSYTFYAVCSIFRTRYWYSSI